MWDMQKSCSLCVAKGRCRHDFARGAEASAWQSYCPNHDTLNALAAGGAHRIRRGSTSVQAAAIDRDHRGVHRTVLGLLLVSLAWLALLAVPPANQHSNLRRLAPVAPAEAVVPPVAGVNCLDTSCLSAQQESALRDLRVIQAQGWIASNPDEIASLPRIASLVQGVQSGEALTCRRAGGTTYYGFMFQNGCSAGGSEAARQQGFKECRPMAGGGACLSN
jgi:hypothetical protein